MKYSLVIPCFNEARNLPTLVARCRDVVQTPDVEILLVDNGSTDDSASVFTDLGLPSESIRIVSLVRNQGYGGGIIAGLRETRGDLVGWTHADMQTDPMDFVRGLKATSAGGSERTFTKGLRQARPIADRVFTAGMSIFETLLLGHAFRDINAQPTIFPRTFMESWIDEAPTDFSLDLFAYYKANVDALKIVRFPVAFGERRFGQSHWNVDWRSKAKFIRRTISYSLELRRQVR